MKFSPNLTKNGKPKLLIEKSQQKRNWKKKQIEWLNFEWWIEIVSQIISFLFVIFLEFYFIVLRNNLPLTIILSKKNHLESFLNCGKIEKSIRMKKKHYPFSIHREIFRFLNFKVN